MAAQRRHRDARSSIAHVFESIVFSLPDRSTDESHMTRDRILLLLTHRGNQRLLQDLLSVQYEVLLARHAGALQEQFDLAVLDGPALHRLQSDVRARKQAEQPVFLPFLLLIHQQDANTLRRDLWHTVDELILTPVHRVELEGRLASLLRVRKDSLDLKRRTEELETLVYDLSESFESATEENELARILLTRAFTATKALVGAVVALEGEVPQVLASLPEASPALAMLGATSSMSALKETLASGPLTGAEATAAVGGEFHSGAPIIAPVAIKREPVAALVLWKAGGAPFSAGDVRIIESLSIQAGVFIHNLRQAHRLVEMAHIQEQIEVAESIQHRLLPASNVQMRGLDLAAFYLATNQIGGDYYDVFAVSPNKVAAVIADVSGHSIASGLLMTAARSATRLLLRDASSPAAILRQLNETLYGDLDQTGLFISLALLMLDLDTREARFANAGHNPPLQFRPTCDDVRDLDATGLLLGILPDATYDEVELTVAAGDTFVFYTDGVTEARDRHGAMFGEDRLRDLVQCAGRLPAGHVANTIRQRVYAHAGGHLADDVTVLVLKLAADNANDVG
jgi:serine phosphatase RsbU (regulator of sigma subunit)